MRSLELEAWRVEDEAAHTVTVSDYYISKFEVTQGTAIKTASNHRYALCAAGYPRIWLR